MVKDRLTKAALLRLQELGLPPYLLEVDDFRSNFLLEGWVLLVRDRGNVTQVDLFHPAQGKRALITRP